MKEKDLGAGCYLDGAWDHCLGGVLLLVPYVVQGGAGFGHYPLYH